jgi:hypothetical protein
VVSQVNVVGHPHRARGSIARYASAFADRVSTASAVDILEAMSLITMCTATLILLVERTEKQADEFAACAYKMLETRMQVSRQPLGLAPGLLLNAHVFLEARSRMRSTIAEVLKRSRSARETGRSWRGSRDTGTRKRDGDSRAPSSSTLKQTDSRFFRMAETVDCCQQRALANSLWH